MKYGITHYFPNGTKENYEAVMAAMNAPHGVVIPKGQLFHAAGPAPGGWLIVAIHDSKESWERFRDQTLMPRMKQGIEGGLVGPPEETAFEVHNLQK